MTTLKAIGHDTPIIDGQAKVTGTLRYAADLKIVGMLYARMVTSPYPHARILSIDKTEALAMPGVSAVLTAKDLPDIAPTERTRLLLARDRVIFTGQPVALVLAVSEAAAQDGVDKVMVEYDPLPAAITMDEALAADAPLVWENGVPDEDHPPRSNRRETKPIVKGDIQAGFAAADVIIERVFETPIVHQSSVETHSMLVQPDPATGGATVWSATQSPYDVRLSVAELLDIPESLVRVIAVPVGGGFGGKFPLYEPLVALAARAVNAPVRLVLTRSEELLATNPAPAMRIRARLGGKRDGTLTAIEGEILLDDGCFPGWMPGLARALFEGQYDAPHIQIKATSVMTFKPSSGSYRGPTAPTVVFALDTLIDELAAQLGCNALELRRKNLRRSDEGKMQGGALEILDILEQHPLWQNREQSRAAGRGVGLALAGWWIGAEPGVALCNLNRDGRLVVNVGIADISGTNTSLALIAAETFGLRPEDIQVVTSDTASFPMAGGTGGSKNTYVTGIAVQKAAEEAKRQLLEIAAQQFEAAVEDIELVDGKVQVRGVPDKAITLQKIASKTVSFGAPYSPVSGQGRVVQMKGALCYCGQLAEVEVDRETGEVRVLQLVIAQDAGKAINPAAVRGQMAGGGTQGIGWALFEQMQYDESGQLLSGSWMDYTVPAATQTAPRIETIIVEVPSEDGLLGARGVGEPPVIPTAAAVANAIAHATGVRLTELPMTPIRVLAAISNEK